MFFLGFFAVAECRVSHTQPPEGKDAGLTAEIGGGGSGGGGMTVGPETQTTVSVSPVRDEPLYTLPLTVLHRQGC